MSPWRFLFAFRGSIARLQFVTAIAAIGIVFAAIVQASLAALPWMAELLAPRGINAGFALNAIWLSAGLLMVWSLTVVTAKRLRAVGRSPWWAPAAVLPPAILALLNDAIFLVSRSLVLPVWLNWLLLVACAALTAVVLAACLRGDREIRGKPTR